MIDLTKPDNIFNHKSSGFWNKPKLISKETEMFQCKDGKTRVFAKYTTVKGIAVETREQAKAAAKWLKKHKRKIIARAENDQHTR